MATAAFKSNSKRSTTNDYVSPKTNPTRNPPEKQKLRRSLSVNAVSRSSSIDISSEFLIKRDNPLYFDDNNTQAPTTPSISAAVVAVALQRGRSVNRNSNGGGQKEEERVSARRRSLSRVNHNGNARRGRSVSRASQSEAGQELRTSVTYGGRSTTDKTFERRSSPPSRRSSVGSYLDSQVQNWEDGISTSSISEAEEKTIKAVYEQMKSFEGDMLRKDTASSEIYETVRSEVRRAIADIQDDLQDAIRRTSTADVIDITPKLVKPGAVELVSDIRREYAKELEVSHERARKLRSDLAIEEHRKQELNRILKQTLPEPKTSSSHRSRFGRKSSSERKMSKRLTDEAMSYFDECVSISTFDSSDFSAAEDLSVNSAAVNSSPAIPTAGLNHCIDQQMIHGDLGSSSVTVTDSTSNVLVIDDNKKQDKKFCFSFGHKPSESVQLQHDFKNYVKTFEKDKGIDGISFQRSRDKYDVDAYNLLDVNERLLFDKVIFKNRQESGSLHICGGVAVPFLPLFHLF